MTRQSDSKVKQLRLQSQLSILILSYFISLCQRQSCIFLYVTLTSIISATATSVFNTVLMIWRSLNGDLHEIIKKLLNFHKNKFIFQRFELFIWCFFLKPYWTEMLRNTEILLWEFNNFFIISGLSFQVFSSFSHNFLTCDCTVKGFLYITNWKNGGV